MDQFDLSAKPPMTTVDHSIIAAQPSMTAALMLCQQLSGVDDKELCGKSGIVKEAAQWSRIRGGQHFFPQDKFCTFMDLCGNEAPLLWLADRRGYLLTPKETELERQLRIERDRADKAEEKLAYLESLHTGRK